MVNRKNILILSLVLALGMTAFFLFRKGEDDREKIKGKLHQLAEIVSVNREKNRKPFLTLISEIKEVINSPCKLDLDEGGLSGQYPPQKIAALLEQFQANVTKARLTFYDMKIHFPQKNSAIIHCTGRMKGFTQSGEKFDEFRELHIEAVKKRGKWRFFRFQTIEALEK